MIENGIELDLYMYTYLIWELSNEGMMHEANSIFIKMTAKHIAPNSVVYGIFMGEYVKIGYMEEAYKI